MSNIIACSTVVNEKISDGKYQVDFISFDDKYYFNVNSKNIIVKELNRIDQLIPFDFEKHENLTIVKWIDLVEMSKSSSYMDDLDNIDIAIENTYNEIDHEVKDLCDSLNTYLNRTAKTLASCSGHGINSLWVAIQFFDLKGISEVLKLINSTEEFKNGFILQSMFIDNFQKYTTDQLTNPVLRLTTTMVGKRAYQLAEKMSEFINTIIV